MNNIGLLVAKMLNNMITIHALIHETEYGI